MIKVKGAVEIGIIAATVLGAALLALGIGFMAPSGEQSKLVYTGDLWCVSNYIEKEPTEYLSDGRPAADPLLSGKDDWIVREQVKAKDKAEAEQKAKTNGHGLFEPSEKTRLRQALQNNERDFFTSHFNQGATAPGPCLGSGSLNHQIGSWLNEQIPKKCGKVNENTDFEVVNKIRVSLTTYSPCMKEIGNTCDCAGCPGHITADTSGKFQVVDGTLQWVKAGKAYKHLFAEPQTDNIIPWADRNRLAVVIVGYDNNTPIYVRDHYGKGVHEGKNYLDLFTPCPLSSAGNVLNALPSKRNGTYEALIVDTAKPASKSTGETALKTLPDGTACPDSNAKTGPSEGSDFQITLAKEYERQMSLKNSSASGGNEGVAGSDNSGQSGQVSTQNELTTNIEGVLPVPGIDESATGLKGKCNRAAAGMAYLYRTGQSLAEKLLNLIKSAANTVGILAKVGTGTVDRNKCASSDNWAEIRDQVINKKNPVVIALHAGSQGHYVTITGFVGDEIYFNDGSHFLGQGNGVVARHMKISKMNGILDNQLTGCRYLYAK
ncbi:MAG: hypothetical protein NTZ65_00325 [Candidatus Berkelbacteria bacterium]|nr:hypothetical protein [Candidatus Berkelbacteria bacterium]